MINKVCNEATIVTVYVESASGLNKKINIILYNFHGSHIKYRYNRYIVTDKGDFLSFVTIGYKKDCKIRFYLQNHIILTKIINLWRELS